MSSTSVIELFQKIDEGKLSFFEELATVADIMSSTVRTVTLDDKLKDAVKLFQEAKIHHAPVIDPDDKEVIGILSDRDVLRATPRYLGKGGEREEDKKAMSTNVSSLMIRKPCHVSPTSPLSEAIALLLEKPFDCLLVYEATTELQGILTVRDILKTILLYLRVCMRNGAAKGRLRLVDMADDVSLEEIIQRGVQTVEDVMTRDVLTLPIDSLISDAIKLLQAEEIRHIPIIRGESKRVAGMVSDRDILKALNPMDSKQLNQNGNEDKFRGRLFATEETEVLSEKLGLIMNNEPVTVTPETSLLDGISSLIEKNISCLLVVDSDHDLCGVLTSNDVLRVMKAAMRFSRPASN